jgi:hypothetical protein
MTLGGTVGCEDQGFGTGVAAGDCEALDSGRDPLGGGSCSTGRGVVCFSAADASFGVGAAGCAFVGGALFGNDVAESLEGELVAGRGLDAGALGEDRAQSVLPLEAAFSGVWQ